MRLLEAIIDANHRALAGDKTAGLRPNDFASSLPLIALTCIDPRLNRILPEVLGVPEEHFIWLRNAGNIITSPMSSTMRSLALACVSKRGREIVVIGHSDCRVRQTSISDLIARFKELGIERSSLPDNLTEFFGVFASERQNVIRATDHIRSSPLISPTMPVHGLMVDINTGSLEWVVNGYETLGRAAIRGPEINMPEIGRVIDASADWGAMKMGEMKFPETKIGDKVNEAKQRIEAVKEMAQAARRVVRPVSVASAYNPPPPPPPPTPMAPPPPPIAPEARVSKTGKWGLRD
jgi:carbonic anhydrase